ncbi:MAG: protein kinase, partial [Pyrinomonadaceae bacterium]|nr:protein kinase [Pyrinomonadaceae bacterium]
MTPERYRQIGELYHAALEVDIEERAAFLDRACAGDDEMRREVESLINSHEEAADFIAKPALAVAAGLFADSQANALIGKSVSRYRILSLIGAGGMGQVYLAEDTELGRRVALKLLPEHFTSDSERVRRFRQEARAASALNHPNIITIHEIGKAGERHYIATEYIEGETLRERL